MSRHVPLVALTALLLAFPALPAASAPAPSPAPVVVIRLDDTVNTVSAEYIARGLAYAARHHAAAAVLEMNTPGGLDTAMRSIIRHIVASPVPVIGYVAPSGSRAASAGFYILLSCDIAAMAPGTNTGAAHPVLLGGEPDKIEAAKMQSDAAAFIRSIATQRHRNVALAQQGVIQSASFTEREALAGHLIDLTAPNLHQLLAGLNGRTITRWNGARQTLALAGAPRLEYAMSLRERILDMNASLAFLLLAVGGILIYIEFTHPGMVLPGVIGIILAVLALFAMALLPIDWSGAALLAVGFALLALEAKFTTHGILALGGVAGIALGGMLLVNSPVPQMRVATGVALGVALGFGAISLLLVELVVRARRRRVMTGAQGLVGEIGTALTALALQGTVMVHGERWRAAAMTPIPAGAAVRVQAVAGLMLAVEPAANAPEAGS